MPRLPATAVSASVSREISVADAGLSREVASLLIAHRNASHFGSTPIDPPACAPQTRRAGRPPIGSSG